MEERIVIALDGSECSQRAATWLAEHFPPFSGEVVAVHGFDEYPYTVGAMQTVVPPPLNPAVREHVRAQLDGWCQPLRDAGVAVRPELVDGPAAGAIIHVAKQIDATLVVVGRRGRGGFSELLLGSVSHHLTHHVGRPLVIVP